MRIGDTPETTTLPGGFTMQSKLCRDDPVMKPRPGRVNEERRQREPGINHAKPLKGHVRVTVVCRDHRLDVTKTSESEGVAAANQLPLEGGFLA